MEADLKKRNTGWKHLEKEFEEPRTDATFTEIFELIYHNQTMVWSELGVLLQLIQNRIRLRKSFFSSCCVCKKIRVDDYGSPKGRWIEVEDFLKEEMDILLSSAYCPKCAQTVQEGLLAQVGRLGA